MRLFVNNISSEEKLVQSKRVDFELKKIIVEIILLLG